MKARNAFIIGQIQAMPVTVEQLQTAICQDPLLSEVLLYAREGWPTKLPEEYKTHLNKNGDCLLWGIQVAIPSKLHASVGEVQPPKSDQVDRVHPSGHSCQAERSRSSTTASMAVASKAMAECAR
jgi:hypothetical protein